MKTLIKNGEIVVEDKIFRGNILIVDDLISLISVDPIAVDVDNVIDATDKVIMPGVIDSHVHFREPDILILAAGATHKADIHSESIAAVAGGVTSFFDMPNTNPQTTDNERLREKKEIARKTSLANYSFYVGATNDNFQEILKTDFHHCPGIKLFLGSSTGNMLLDNQESLEELFKNAPALICVHAEDEAIIKANLSHFKALFGEDIPFNAHRDIRSNKACFCASERAVRLAKKYNKKLHIMHLSTKEELELILNSAAGADNELITAEAVIAHLWFTDQDYAEKGGLIKINPSIKTIADRDALRKAVISGKISTISTDHAPHTLEEKKRDYLHCPSGSPMIQHSLLAMLELFDYREVTRAMCWNPAKLFGVEKRGFIRQGYKADLVIIEKKNYTVNSDNILYKCGWSAMENTTFNHSIYATFVNGNLAYFDGKVDEDIHGEEITFNI